jgi:hypothetical protein
MLKRSLLIAGLVVVATALLAGNDPWKDKPYKQWDATDVQKVMTESPWAKTVSVSASWRPSGSKAGVEGGVTRNGGGGNMAGNSGSTNAPASEAPVGENQAQFYVRWDSSLTVRQAFVRNRELKGTPEDQAEKLLEHQPEMYVLSVSGQDMSPFTKTDEMALKEKSYLMAKKSKQKLSPDRVEILRAPNAQKILGVNFYFSRKSASGEVTIPVDEKQVEFSCETPVTKIHTSFDLSKMAGPKGTDI